MPKNLTSSDNKGIKADINRSTPQLLSQRRSIEPIIKQLVLQIILLAACAFIWFILHFILKMERLALFCLGFVVAGLIGWISRLIVQRWVFINRRRRQSFKISPENVDKEIKINPFQWSVQIKRGCLNTLVLMLLPIIMLTAISAIIFILQREIIPAFLLGVIFAPVVRIILGLQYRSLSDVQNLYYRIRQLNVDKGGRKKIEKWLILLRNIFINVLLFFSDKEEFEKILFDDDFFGEPQRIEILKKLIASKNRNLNKLKEQRASYGELHVSPHILIEIENIEAELEELKAKLDVLNSHKTTSTTS